MPSDPFPFGADTLAIPAYLVSDENDPAYRAWLAEHPDAFVAGTWTRPARRRRPMPPDVSQPIRPYVDPDAGVPTLDLVARSNLSTDEFMHLAAAARVGAPAPHAPERPPPAGPSESHRAPALSKSRPPPEDYRQQLTDAEFKQRNIDDLATIMVNEARGQGELGMTAVGSTVWNRMLRNHVASVRSVWGGYAHSSVDPHHNEIATFAQARRIAEGILDGTTKDRIGGADHYYSPKSMPQEGDDTRNKDVGGGLEAVPGVIKKDNAIRNYRPGWAPKFIRKPVEGLSDKDFKFYEQPGGRSRVE